MVLFKMFEKAEPENVSECRWMWPRGKMLFHIVPLEKECFFKWMIKCVRSISFKTEKKIN